MRGRRLFQTVRVRVSFAVALAAVVGSARATVIVPPMNSSYTGSDSGGQRINIDQTNPLVFSPGTYTANTFSFFAINRSTSTVPFLVVNSDPLTANPAGDIDEYKIIAVGSTITTAPLSPTNAPQTVPFGGGADATFTLTAPTKVFAAVSSGNADINSIGFISEGSVDHSNAFNPVFTPAVGGVTQPLTNPDLGRTYGFNIEVVPGVPEPAAGGVAVFVSGLLLHRRRR